MNGQRFTINIGMISLGTMGRNPFLNIADHGFSAFGYDVDAAKAALLTNEQTSSNVSGTADLQEFVSLLDRPRAIIMLVPAGKPVDTVNQALLPLLEEGDIIIDGGNSHFRDTERRQKELAVHDIHIEYDLMQLIAESYHLLKGGCGLDDDELHELYSAWNQGELSSFLVEITAGIFATRDQKTGQRLVDLILGEAEQKGVL